MRYVRLQNALPVEISSEYPGSDAVWARRDVNGNGWISVRDLHSFTEVETLARYMTAMSGKTYLPVDHGSHTSPQFDVLEAPQVGDAVSYAFNGDYYPCGHIARITKNWMIVTTEGQKFNRPGNAGGWRMVGGTWSLVAGHIDERNPSF